MATHTVDRFISLNAATNYTNHQYYAVTYASTEGEFILPISTGVLPLGSLWDKPEDGDAARIASAHGEIIKFAAGSTSISIGNNVGPVGNSTSTGLLEPKSSDGDPIVGIALQASATSGQIISVYFSPRFLGTGGA